MPPVVLPEDSMMDNGYHQDVSGEDIEYHDKTGQKPGLRRDSDGSTGYSTCSSNLSSVSHQHEDRSPRSPDSQDGSQDTKTSQVEEEGNDGDVETNNDDDENGNEMEISQKSDKH